MNFVLVQTPRLERFVPSLIHPAFDSTILGISTNSGNIT